MKQLNRELDALRKENKELMIVSASKMQKQINAERKLTGVMSHVLGGINMWMPRVDERTSKEMARVREKIEEIANG